MPFAVDEADRLYNKHMYVSLALSQMWRTREDCITAESGLEHMPGEEEFQSSTFTSNVSNPNIIHKVIIHGLSLLGPGGCRAAAGYSSTRCED